MRSQDTDSVVRAQLARSHLQTIESAMHPPQPSLAALCRPAGARRCAILFKSAVDTTLHVRPSSRCTLRCRTQTSFIESFQYRQAARFVELVPNAPSRI